jgi:hypothetical protein
MYVSLNLYTIYIYMSRKYNELKNIRNLYDTAFDNYNNDSFLRSRDNLKKYLKKLKLNTITGAQLFIKTFKTEIPLLGDPAKRNLSILANKTLQQLQTGEIIDLSDIPNVNDVAWPTALLESIRKTNRASGIKRKVSRKKRKSLNK